MWRNANCGNPSPIVTIIKPSWLDVEKAMIFLISFCVRAQIAVNKVVSAPKHRQIVIARGLWLIIGNVRISKKIPATTIVLEWSRAETGVGPSMADGSQGWRPNWADLPAAARISARAGIVVFWVWRCRKISSNSHEFVDVIVHAITTIRPRSPARLYSTACRAAVLASGRANHQLIRRNDIIPTPSQPINNWNKLLAVTRIIIEIRKIKRYLKNWSIFGSFSIYHSANWRMDQVT